MQKIEKFVFDNKSRLVKEQRFQSEVLVLHKVYKYSNEQLKEIMFLDNEGYVVRIEKFYYNFFNGFLKKKLYIDFRVFSEIENFKPSKTRYNYKYIFLDKKIKM